MSGRIVESPGECDRCPATEDVHRVGCRWLCPDCRDELRDAAQGPL